MMISQYFHESILAHMERTVKRLWITIILLIVLHAACIVALLVYLNQYDFESYSYEQDGQGINVIGEDNEVQQYEPTVSSSETDAQE